MNRDGQSVSWHSCIQLTREHKECSAVLIDLILGVGGREFPPAGGYSRLRLGYRQTHARFQLMIRER